MSPRWPSLTARDSRALPVVDVGLVDPVAQRLRVHPELLHLAAGIVLAVVGLELMPEALTATPPWVPILAFVAGGAFFIGLTG